MIRSSTVHDAAGIARIYNHYVLNSTVTFEEQPVGEAEIADRIRKVHAQSLPYEVAEDDGRVVGFAYAGPWVGRSAYRFSAETSVYIDPDFRGQGLGTRLYELLIRDLRAKKIHAVIAIIALPNEVSVALHERFGFQKVAHFREVGWKFERWIDVGYWQLML
jgi:L-amino acid N-acyltransferase YncA